ncbi:MAG: sodium/solute symporter [Candidatus Marinimicrobia bacterium]|jgi:solute:Na+ symporter, SSS family|nr:sodium/solute symporter [Candidatus Neomarinimicrobiota bacterium]MBT4361625.1 sodium/solute symporter [Candidatus Neomarinimicrobiota bacterium]MBT4714011.1 sodium/solute symporter [Candidatus Neomarinimicrobiota bacterium]MBT4947033.1 sodium/solute symporter [Candidatus Neomarinimicrobiota bacterium]MBT5268469.1 sodium/solute symporter [Candidatus Neomarinimicrobiota bacterium]
MSGLDFVVIILYFVLVIGVGIYFSRRNTNSTEYFLAGRNVGWIAIGASLFASNISSEHFIGLAGTGSSSGLAVGHFEWLAAFMVLFLGWIFVPFYLKSGVFTMPEFLEKRYGKASRRYLTSVSIIAYVITKISVTLYAGGLLIHKILGWDMMTSAIVLIVVTGIYTIAGGLSAVIYTELVQAFILIGGAIALTLLGLNEVGGFTGLQAKLPVEYFQMFKAFDHPDFPWTGIIFGAPILGVWYWCTDQFIVQRVLSAKNINHARSGAILAGFLKILPVFILVLPGLIAAALFGTTGDEAYPTLVTSYLLPSGIKGIVIASLLAALMSSLASVFNSTSTLFTIDFYKNFRPDSSEAELVLVGRLATTVMVVLGVLTVPLITMLSGQLFVYLQSVQAYISPPIAAVFILGIFWSRANATGAISALGVGAVLGASRFVLEILVKSGTSLGGFEWFATMNFLHFAVFLFLVSVGVLVTVSLITVAPLKHRISGLTMATASELQTDLSRRMDEQDAKWNRNNIIASVVLVIAIIGLWIKFA